MSPSCSLGFSCVCLAWKSFLFGHMINPYLIKPVRQSGWILASLCQYPATLTSRLVNKTYILLFCWNKNPQALKFKLKSLNFIMLYKQDNSGKKIYRRKLYSGKFTKWNNFKSGRSNLAIAGENSQHFAAPPIVYSWNDVWEMSTKIPYWWHVTSQIWLVLLIGWKFASSNQKHYPIVSIEFLCSFLKCHFVGKPVGGSRNVCCFPMLIANLAILTKTKEKRKTLKIDICYVLP